MKILIKKGKKSFGIKIPLGAVKLIPAGLINRAISKHRDMEDDSTAQKIDFTGLKKAIYLLKEYKGLNIIEIENSKGDGVVVRI